MQCFQAIEYKLSSTFNTDSDNKNITFCIYSTPTFLFLIDKPNPRLSVGGWGAYLSLRQICRGLPWGLLQGTGGKPGGRSTGSPHSSGRGQRSAVLCIADSFSQQWSSGQLAPSTVCYKIKSLNSKKFQKSAVHHKNKIIFHSKNISKTIYNTPQKQNSIKQQ